MSYLTLESSFREEEKQMAEKTYKTLSSSGRIQKALKQAEYAIVHDKVGFIGFLILLAAKALQINSEDSNPCSISKMGRDLSIICLPAMILHGSAISGERI